MAIAIKLITTMISCFDRIPDSKYKQLAFNLNLNATQTMIKAKSSHFSGGFYCHEFEHGQYILIWMNV